MKRFQHKTVWITGASSGIGSALAMGFAAEGARLILSGRRKKALKRLSSVLPTDCMILPFEATDFDRLKSRVESAWEWSGCVDVLVNNAGVSQRSLARETTPEVYTELINVDLLAPIWLTQLQLNRMIANGGGHIVAISSVAGRVGVPLRTAYCAAKHGLIGYMDALRAEVSLAHNIRVTNVLPGSIATEISRNALTGDGSKRGSSDDIIDKAPKPFDCAIAILDAVSDNVPELLYAFGNELEYTRLRHTAPAKLFELTAAFGEQLSRS